MGNENEPAKLLLPYLQRADELQAHDPLVAYYCRLYAMERGLKIPQTERTKTTNSLLVSLMKQLEKDKKSLQLGPDDSLHLEGFALNVFAKADKQDRAGRADKSTAKTFYAASIFFEILNQFGQLQPDIEQKQKYAAWKAADISKALKEGKKPVPGPPGADNDLSSPSSSGYNDMDPGMKPASEFDPSSGSYDQVDPQKSSDTAPFPSEITKSSTLDIPPSAYPAKKFPSQSFHQPPSTDDYPSHNYHQAPLNDDYSSHNSHQPPSLTSRSENNLHAHPQEHHQQPFPQEHHLQPFPQEHHQQPFPQEHHQQPFPQEHHLQPFPQEHQQQPFPQEPPQHLPQYHSHDTSSFSSYPNFQTYPSFTESSLPAAPSHPPYYQGSGTSYNVTSASDALNYPSTAHQSSNGRIGTISDIEPTPVQEYKYSNYQPPAEKISEAHKAARFAVGALAFDDVSIAVDYLKKSLELLTNPSAGQ